MTRDVNLALAGPIAGLTILALAGLMGCAAAAVPGSTGPSGSATAPLPTVALTYPPGGMASGQPLRPVAELETAEGTILGELGTYSMDGVGSDAPWLPFAAVPAVEASSAEVLQIRFADGAAIGDVSAEFAAADDTRGAHPLGVPTGARADDGRSVSLGPLPAGRWVLEARVFRADGRGDGLTYWAITVH